MKLGHELELGEIDLSEVKAGSLASVLRQAYESTAEARRARGMAGARLVHGGFTWLSVGDLIEKRREELDDGKKPFRFRFWAVVS